LIEMLVAVGLVVLMMTLFATIFQMATGAMSTQKGLAENDQRVRLVLTRLRNDLNGRKNDANDPNRPYRTFLNLVPWGPDESTTVPTADVANRGGYLYISENDPNDDTDDVLALTVAIPAGSAERFFGRASLVFPDAAGNYGTPGAGPLPGAAPYPPAAPASVTIANPPGQGQQYWPNQPEFDDVQGTPNGAGDSQFAEVCYFLRRGTLYRRVMLIRQPNLSPPLLATDGNPTDNALAVLNVPSIYGAGANPSVARNFWTDFDYSAYFDGRSAVPSLRFHGTGNTVLATGDSILPNVAPTNPFVLGNPAYRFGFDSSVTAAALPTATYGQPREYISTGPAGTPPNSTFFIGRFTHSETSDMTFGYPGNLGGASGNPMNLGTNLNFNTTTGAVSNYAGPRGGEDALMTNVLKFDIKVFDPAASFGPDGAPGVAGVDDDGDGFIDSPAIPVGAPRPFNPATDPPDLKELGWPGSDDGDFRDIGHQGITGFYNATNVATGAYPRNVPVTMKYIGLPAAPANVATWTNLYTYPNPRYASAATNVNRFDTWNPLLDHDNDTISDCPPFRPFDFGPDGKPGVPGVDDDMDGVTDNISELGWPNPLCDDQPYPLIAIQIRIVFYDRTSKQVRETTLVESLAKYNPPIAPFKVGSYTPFP
jgi:hypothetical protein